MQKSARANRPTRAACSSTDGVVYSIVFAVGVVIGVSGNRRVVLSRAATNQASTSHTSRGAHCHGVQSSIPAARGPRAAACGPCVGVSSVVNPAGLVVGSGTEWHIAPGGEDLVPESDGGEGGCDDACSTCNACDGGCSVLVFV